MSLVYQCESAQVRQPLITPAELVSRGLSWFEVLHMCSGHTSSSCASKHTAIYVCFAFQMAMHILLVEILICIVLTGMKYIFEDLPIAEQNKLLGHWDRRSYGEFRHCGHCFWAGVFISIVSISFYFKNSWFSLWMPSASITEFTVKWRTCFHDWAQTSQSGLFFPQTGWILGSSSLKDL